MIDNQCVMIFFEKKYKKDVYLSPSQTLYNRNAIRIMFKKSHNF